MRFVSSFKEVSDCINRLRSLRKGVLTNFYPDQRKIEIWCSHTMLWMLEMEETIIFLKKNDGFTSVMYCTTNTDNLYSALVHLPQDDVYVVDQIVDSRTNMSILDTLEKAGYKVRKSLVRMSKINEEELLADLDNNFYVDENDIPILTRLLYENFDKYSEQLPTLEELKDFIDAQHVIIKKVGEKIAGFIIYDQTPSTLYLRYWFVNNQFRNQGVGSSLFREYSRRGGRCKRHILWVMEDNHNAIIRYKHYGYNEENMKNYVLIFNLRNK